ncbi:hypothetical protein EMIT0194P_120185 [Pseudomonas serbica]
MPQNPRRYRIKFYRLLIGHWVADCAVGDLIRMGALRADYSLLRLSIRRCRRKATCFAPLDPVFPGLSSHLPTSAATADRVGPHSGHAHETHAHVLTRDGTEQRA